MVNGQAGARAREESVMQASTSIYGTTCVTTISLTSNTQLEKVKKFAYTGWTKYLVNQQLYCTRNAQVRLTLERFWKIARILTKLAIRISHSWPTTNCKLLGLRWRCCCRVGPPSSCRVMLLNSSFSHLHGRKRDKQNCVGTAIWRRVTRTFYANGWTVLFVNGVGQIVYWKNAAFFFGFFGKFDRSNVC